MGCGSSLPKGEELDAPIPASTTQSLNTAEQVPAAKSSPLKEEKKELSTNEPGVTLPVRAHPASVSVSSGTRNLRQSSPTPSGIGSVPKAPTFLTPQKNQSSSVSPPLPRGYRVSAPGGDGPILPPPRATNYRAITPVSGDSVRPESVRPEPSAASVNNPGEAKRFLGIFQRRPPSSMADPHNYGLAKRGISGVHSTAPSMSGVSYSLGSNADLNHPRRRLSIVESIRQGLGIQPPSLQIPADIQEEVTSPEITSIRRGSAPDSTKQIKSATSRRGRGLMSTPSKKVHFQGGHSMGSEASNPQSQAHSGGKSHDGFFISDTTDADGGTPRSDALADGMGTLTGWQMLAAEVMKEIEANGGKAQGNDKGGEGEMEEDASPRADLPRVKSKRSALKSREFQLNDDEDSGDGGKRAKSENPKEKRKGMRRPGIFSDDGKNRPKTADEKERSFRGVLKNPSRGDLNRVSSNTKLVRFSDVQDVDRLADSDGEDTFSVSGRDLFRSLRWNTQDKAPFKERYTLHELMGSGAYGKAYRATRTSDGAEFVVKVLEVGMMSSRMKREARNEVTLLSQLDHPNIVKYYECVVEGDHMYIVMEYCEGGDLTKFLKARRGKPLDEEGIMTYFVQICIALDYIHKKGVLHRDLKSSNLFLTKGKIVKLGDFGIARSMNNGSNLAKTMVGTPYYLSPEICQEKPYNHKSDIWSLGCVLYEICALRRAFDGKSLPALIVRIMDGHYKPLPDTCSDHMRSLVSCLLMKDPEDRPAAEDILSLDFVRIHLKKYALFLRSAMFARAESLLNATLPFSRSPMPSQNQREKMHAMMEADKLMEEEGEGMELIVEDPEEELKPNALSRRTSTRSRGASIADVVPVRSGPSASSKRPPVMTTLSDVSERALDESNSNATTRTNLTDLSDGRSLISNATSNKSLGSSKWGSDYSRISGASGAFKSFSEGQHTLSETVRKSLSGKRYDAIMAISGEESLHGGHRRSADDIPEGDEGAERDPPMSMALQGTSKFLQASFVPGVVMGDDEVAAVVRSASQAGGASNTQSSIQLASVSSLTSMSMQAAGLPVPAAGSSSGSLQQYPEGSLLKQRSSVNFTPLRDHNDVGLSAVQNSPVTPTLPKKIPGQVGTPTTATAINSSIDAMGTFILPQLPPANPTKYTASDRRNAVDGHTEESESGFSFGEPESAEHLNQTAELRSGDGATSSSGNLAALPAAPRAPGAGLSSSAGASGLAHHTRTDSKGSIGASRPASSSGRPGHPPIPRPGGSSAPPSSASFSGAKGHLPPSVNALRRGPVEASGGSGSGNTRVEMSSRDPSEIHPSMPSLAVGIAPGSAALATAPSIGKMGAYAALSVIPPSPVLSPASRPQQPPAKVPSDRDARRRLPLEDVAMSLPPSAGVTPTPKTETPAKEAYHHYLTSTSQRRLLAAAEGMRAGSNDGGSTTGTTPTGVGIPVGAVRGPTSAPVPNFKSILKSPSDRGRPSAQLSRKGLPPIRPSSLHVSSENLRADGVPEPSRSREESNISRVSSHISRTSVVEATDQYRGMRTALTQVNELITRPATSAYWSRSGSLAGRSFNMPASRVDNPSGSSSQKTAASLGLQSRSSSMLGITASSYTTDLSATASEVSTYNGTLAAASFQDRSRGVSGSGNAPSPAQGNPGLPTEQPTVEELLQRQADLRKEAEKQVNKALLEAAIVYVRTTSVVTANGSQDLSAVLERSMEEQHPMQIPEMQFNYADLARILGPNGKDVAPLVLRLCMLDEQIKEAKLGIYSTPVSRQPSGVPQGHHLSQLNA